jgi:hypothetical protein
MGGTHRQHSLGEKRSPATSYSFVSVTDSGSEGTWTVGFHLERATLLREGGNVSQSVALIRGWVGCRK